MITVKVGKFEIWPESDSGARSNDLLITRDTDRLILSSGVEHFYGSWDTEGWHIEPRVFAGLTVQETDMLRFIGMNLLPGILGEPTARNLEERVHKIGSGNLEVIFEKVFGLCREEVTRIKRQTRRMSRPRLLRWLPIK